MSNNSMHGSSIDMIIPVILSGGTGSRLWPISREAHPKPFIALPDGQSLLQKTFSRACSLQVSDLITITNSAYHLKSKDEYDKARIDAKPNLHFLLEPLAKNTAPAIAIAALYAKSLTTEDPTLLILPADHLITPVDLFVNYCEQAFHLADSGKLVTFGIKPSKPETGYGYIECNQDDNTVLRFIEKPTAEIAETYLASGRYLWNSGMFCFKASALLSELSIHAPTLLNEASDCLESSRQNGQTLLLDKKTFDRFSAISIDYALMEKSQNLSVIACDFAWQDIGSFDAYEKLFHNEAQRNTIVGDAVMIDADNNFILSEDRLIAAIGVNNLAIIDTPDALLITDRHRSQDVKQVVEQLKSKQHESYLTHRTVIRPWGSYTVLEEGPAFKIKRIVVKPGAALSLQKHSQRSEHWVVVEGTATIQNGDKTYTLETNESTFVPKHTPHRLSNPSDKPLVIIEVQTGAYLGEDDIVRLEDLYERV